MPPPRSHSDLGLDSGAGLSPVPGFMGNRRLAGLAGSLQGRLPLTTADGRTSQGSPAATGRPAVSRLLGSHLVLWTVWRLLGAWPSYLTHPLWASLTQEPAVFICPLPCLAPPLVILMYPVISFRTDRKSVV